MKRGEVRPEVHAGPCPRWMPGAGRAAWRYYAPLLARLRILTRVDVVALEVLCVTYAEWRSAVTALRKHGQTYESVTEGGGVIVRKRPECELVSDSSRRIRAMLVEFGLTPAARTKVEVTEPRYAEDKIKRFFG